MIIIISVKQKFGIMQGLHRSSEELHSNRGQLVMKLFDGT